ncbi:hypothetical protein B0H63DRAFT_526779 [Podospora didyma]|uniref:Uncharacterized protein n=1 Tax=Podospora didyma TaxID=330526 RepID=A0AAE0N5U1_9PEZI|nr:hypothetical protein B0H63DRAFT_526779 [Podospora didyma]
MPSIQKEFSRTFALVTGVLEHKADARDVSMASLTRRAFAIFDESRHAVKVVLVVRTDEARNEALVVKWTEVEELEFDGNSCSFVTRYGRVCQSAIIAGPDKLHGCFSKEPSLVHPDGFSVRGDNIRLSIGEMFARNISVMKKEAQSRENPGKAESPPRKADQGRQSGGRARRSSRHGRGPRVELWGSSLRVGTLVRYHECLGVRAISSERWDSLRYLWFFSMKTLLDLFMDVVSEGEGEGKPWAASGRTIQEMCGERRIPDPCRELRLAFQGVDVSHGSEERAKWPVFPDSQVHSLADRFGL